MSEAWTPAGSSLASSRKTRDQALGALRPYNVMYGGGTESLEEGFGPEYRRNRIRGLRE